MQRACGKQKYKELKDGNYSSSGESVNRRGVG